jgi:phosphopantothenoylcysteine decarboxylase / phosphopantothenate---cysteine ligase
MTGKTLVLGIGGGIACYKMADLASKLTQRGASVHSVLTASAIRFIAPLTFQALTHNPALTSLWSDDAQDNGKSAGMPHIALADAADLIFIAPATADLIARLAAGMADDLLTTLVLATKAPIAVAPAMNPQMLAHPATQRNIAILRGFGYYIIEPNEGRMACEHVGSGRLPETPELLEQLDAILSPRRDLAGKRIVVTAGPTREALDPVRYLSNRSSGKMGYAIAEAAAKRGAHVTLVSGPTNLPAPPQVRRIGIQTALELRAATLEAFQNADILVAAAAPADFRAGNPAPQKMKRGASRTLSLELVANPDIVAECAAHKQPHQLVIGFAAETHNLHAEAARKLRDKHLDAIVANDVTQENAGFDVDTNKVFFITSQNSEEWPLLPKTEVAQRLWNAILLLDTAEPEASAPN